MTIRRLLRNSSRTAEEIACIQAAYEEALRTLSVPDRDDPLGNSRENRHQDRADRNA